MATMHGYSIALGLVKDHGWKWDESPHPEDWYGDQSIIDPVTGESCTPYEALDIQVARNEGR